MPKGLPTLNSILSPLNTDYVSIGFIGQGWIGKNYADDFEKRGYSTVRYSLEPQYAGNLEKIKNCDVVFIAVPTPTTPEGFDASIVEGTLALVGVGKIAVLKSTILPGTTERLQKKYPHCTLLYVPEFLSEATAAQDAAHPFSNIIGLSSDDSAHRAAAEKVLSVLPPAPFTMTCTSTEAEFIKYSHNLNGYFQIMLANVLYDAAAELGAEWERVRVALDNDPYVANRYGRPVHKSGRGAGGGCFIKDFAAFRELYSKVVPNDAAGLIMLRAIERKNVELLEQSGKDPHLVRGVYGENPQRAVSSYVFLPPMRGVERILAAAGAMVVLAGFVDIAARLL